MHHRPSRNSLDREIVSGEVESWGESTVRLVERRENRRLGRALTDGRKPASCLRMSHWAHSYQKKSGWREIHDGMGVQHFYGRALSVGEGDMHPEKVRYRQIGDKACSR